MLSITIQAKTYPKFNPPIDTVHHTFQQGGYRIMSRMKCRTFARKW